MARPSLQAVFVYIMYVSCRCICGDFMKSYMEDCDGNLTTSIGPGVTFTLLLTSRNSGLSWKAQKYGCQWRVATDAGYYLATILGDLDRLSDERIESNLRAWFPTDVLTRTRWEVLSEEEEEKEGAIVERLQTRENEGEPRRVVFVAHLTRELIFRYHGNTWPDQVPTWPLSYHVWAVSEPSVFDHRVDNKDHMGLQSMCQQTTHKSRLFDSTKIFIHDMTHPTQVALHTNCNITIATEAPWCTMKLEVISHRDDIIMSLGNETLTLSYRETANSERVTFLTYSKDTPEISLPVPKKISEVHYEFETNGRSRSRFMGLAFSIVTDCGQAPDPDGTNEWPLVINAVGPNTITEPGSPEDIMGQNNGCDPGYTQQNTSTSTESGLLFAIDDPWFRPPARRITSSTSHVCGNTALVFVVASLCYRNGLQ